MYTIPINNFTTIILYILPMFICWILSLVLLFKIKNELAAVAFVLSMMISFFPVFNIIFIIILLLFKLGDYIKTKINNNHG